VGDQRLQRSRRQEARGASLHGGSRNAGSGNTPWRKNDVRVDRDYLIEYKRTDKKSITIKLEDLETCRTNALLEGREPLLGIEIGGRDWVMVEAAEFERIRSGCARTGLDAGEVPRARPRTVLSPDGASAQEATAGSEGRVPGNSRPRRVSRARGLS
jgi:hypothetical protein